MLLAGGLAASKGILSLPLVILVGASAAIVGDNLGYLVGRVGGRPLLFRYGRVLHVKDRQLAILDSFFERHGPKTVFFGRWVIFLRVWAALFAGASRMHWRQFVFWNALGGMAWATTMASLAYVFAASVVRISKVFGVLAWVFAIAVGIAVGIFISRMQKRAENRQQVEAAEERIRLERAACEERRGRAPRPAAVVVTRLAGRFGSWPPRRAGRVLLRPARLEAGQDGVGHRAAVVCQPSRTSGLVSP